MFRCRSRMSIFAAIAAIVIASQAAYGANPFRGSGFQLDERDLPLLDVAARKLYLAEHVEVGAVESWTNPETGNRGTVTLIEIHEYEGLPCRRLQHDVELKRARDPYRFTVDRCRTRDGEWKILAR